MRLRLGVFRCRLNNDRSATLERLELGLQFSPAGSGGPSTLFNQPLHASTRPLLQFWA